MSERDPWFRIGHTTHTEDRTGCTVIVFNDLVPAVVDVRGGAPGTRETDLLQPGRQVGKADAFLFAGSSAFGLAAADGVVQWLAEHDRGFPTRVGPVPIVPGAVIFDLGAGSPLRVTAEDGYAAAVAAQLDNREWGQVGAGTGATVAKLGGTSVPGGIGIGTVIVGDRSVSVVVVLNAIGDIRNPDTGQWIARAPDPAGLDRTGRELAIASIPRQVQGENTTIGVVLVSGAAGRDALIRCCISAHDALARCVVPAHTLFDGDTFFAASESDGITTPVEILALASATEVAVERAILGIFDDRTPEELTGM